MTQYSTHKKNSDQWHSTPFYTGPEGYKLCIRVDSNGFSTGTGTHVSVFVCLMSGEYDSRLVLPFRGDITIQLVNYKNVKHHEEIVHFNNASAAGDKAAKVCGRHKFISHTDVESSTSTRRYIDNNSLTFRITKIAVYSV